MENIFDFLDSHRHHVEIFREHALMGYYFSRSQETLSSEFKSQYERQWIHNQIILCELNEISNLMVNKNLKACLLKGADLIQTLYSDLGSRFLSDIDLLIQTKDLHSWVELLTEQGFIFQQGPKFYGDDYKHVCTKLIDHIELNIELHTKLFFHHSDEQWTTEPASPSGFMRLSNTDNFLYLCAHLGFQHNFTKLYWLFDVYFFSKKHIENWDAHTLAERAKHLKIYRSVQISLWLCQQYFSFELPRDFKNKFAIEHSVIWKFLLPIDQLISPYNNLFRYYLLKHATKDRWQEAFYYDLKWFYHLASKKLLPRL